MDKRIRKINDNLKYDEEYSGACFISRGEGIGGLYPVIFTDEYGEPNKDYPYGRITEHLFTNSTLIN